MWFCPLLPAELEELGDEVGAGVGGQPGSGLGGTVLGEGGRCSCHVAVIHNSSSMMPAFGVPKAP